MKLIVVDNSKLEQAFIKVNVDVNSAIPHYIRPLDKDISEVFDAAKNSMFSRGEVIRWILQNDNGEHIGRIAAFVMDSYTNKGDNQPTGCFGFFDCINNQEAANMLLDAAAAWLRQRGKEAMDGPVNFGERDKWWGLLIEGFHEPLYGMNFNPPYYRQLLENYGMEIFYNQICMSRHLRPPLAPKFTERHKKISDKGGFRAEMIQLNRMEKYAADFAEIYNKAWAVHEGGKHMSAETALRIFTKMKPVMDPKLAWFAYHNNTPIAFYINIPELNQIFRHLNGKFNWWAKLKFLYYLRTGACNKFTGIVFGVIPRYQSLGIDSFLIVEVGNVLLHTRQYSECELQWFGDFNPKIRNIASNLEFKETRRLATFRYLFDRAKPFVRHPIFE